MRTRLLNAVAARIRVQAKTRQAMQSGAQIQQWNQDQQKENADGLLAHKNRIINRLRGPTKQILPGFVRRSREDSSNLLLFFSKTPTRPVGQKTCADVVSKSS
jgi:hypothetical protein